MTDVSESAAAFVRYMDVLDPCGCIDDMERSKSAYDFSKGYEARVGENPWCFNMAKMPDNGQDYSVAIKPTRGTTIYIVSASVGKGARQGLCRWYGHKGRQSIPIIETHPLGRETYDPENYYHAYAWREIEVPALPGELES